MSGSEGVKRNASRQLEWRRKKVTFSGLSFSHANEGIWQFYAIEQIYHLANIFKSPHPDLKWCQLFDNPHLCIPNLCCAPLYCPNLDFWEADNGVNLIKGAAWWKRGAWCWVTNQVNCSQKQELKSISWGTWRSKIFSVLSDFCWKWDVKKYEAIIMMRNGYWSNQSSATDMYGWALFYECKGHRFWNGLQTLLFPCQNRINQILLRFADKTIGRCSNQVMM